jgi:hypothetical protein
MVEFAIGVLLGGAAAWYLLRMTLRRRALELQIGWHDRVAEKNDEIAVLRSELGARQRAMSASERRVRYLESALAVSLQDKQGASV